MKKKLILIIIAVFAFLGALGLTLYPLISTAYNESHRSEIQTHYEEKVMDTDRSKLMEELQKAHAYNRNLTDYSQEALLEAENEYKDCLNLMGDGIMGYVKVPKINVQLPIYHGTNADTLEVGVGHLLGSSLPVGGNNTHSVLTAHSGMATDKMFSDLPQMEEGDVFYLEILGETLAYQIDQIKTVTPYDTTYLSIVDGDDLCTLVTCTPFGVNTHRLLVRGTRIPYEEAIEIQEEIEAVTEPASTWEQHYVRGILLGIGGSVFLLLLGYIIWKGWKKRHDH